MNGSKWTVTTFYTTPHMPTYLAAFAVCDYEYVSRIERGKEVSEGMPQERVQTAHPLPREGLLHLHSAPTAALWRSFYGKAAREAHSRQLLSPLFPGYHCLSEHGG